MSVPPEDFLFEAITNSWIQATRTFLDRGGDPNLDMRNKSITFGQFRILCHQGQSLKPLHVAVAKFCRRMDTEGDDALVLMDALLQAGACLESGASFSIVRLGAYAGPQKSCEGCTPLGFALWLTEQKELKLKLEHAPTRAKVDTLMAKLLPKTLAEGVVETSNTKVSVPVSVLETYKTLLNSQKLSDFQFVCNDGTSLPAHRAVLAAASPYFAAAFAGPWAENTTSEWNTKYSSSLVKSLLNFVYVGDMTGVREHPVDILSLAGEWDIQSLKDAAISCCADAMTVENFAMTIQLACLYDSARLKQACIRFARRNVAAVLTNPDVMNLSNENAKLWMYLKSTIVPEN